MRFGARSFFAFALFCAFGQQAIAQSQVDQRKPTPGFSIAQAGPQGQLKDGPGFDRIKRSFKAAAGGSESSFNALFDANASASLGLWSGPVGKYFSHSALKAMYQSCIGPYSFDESAAWIQLSWVCSVDSNSNFSAYYMFNESPELTFTIWLKNGRISEIVATEPPPFARRRLPMNAYEEMKVKQ